VEGLDVFVGPEALIFEGIRAGAVGAVSGLAAAYPDKVAAVVRDPSEAGAIELGELRAAVERFPRHAALKFILGLRGVPLREDVRRPLRQLSDGEREELRGWLESS
jgi:dihydrodipicolinate synthase/N-acetylneuraminate lyase